MWQKQLPTPLAPKNVFIIVRQAVPPPMNIQFANQNMVFSSEMGQKPGLPWNIVIYTPEYGLEQKDKGYTDRDRLVQDQLVRRPDTNQRKMGISS